jgi:uncharacterized membrane protein
MRETSTRSNRENSSSRPIPLNAIAFGTGALVVLGLSRRSKAGTALATAAGVLAFTAAKSQLSNFPTTARATFLVNAGADKAYELWRRFENLPRFMAHVKSIRALDDSRSEWVAKGLLGQEIRWTAEMTEDFPNQRIAWSSLPDSDVMHRGFVEFRPDPLGRGTFVTAEVQYDGMSAVGSALASLLGKHPEFMVREDLRRFKALLEAGEVATTVGQTHGPRGVHGHVEQVLFRETSNHPYPQFVSETSSPDSTLTSAITRSA